MVIHKYLDFRHKMTDAPSTLRAPSHSIYIFTHLNLWRGSETQLQVGENYSRLFNLRPNLRKSLCLNTHFVRDNIYLIG